jgi:hypothetical protein
MSCDITIFAEAKKKGKWQKVKKCFTSQEGKKTEHPFGWQNYGLFGFLADVRNYSGSETIKIPAGVPVGLSQEVQSEYEQAKESACCNHSFSYLRLSDLLAFDYDKKFVNVRSDPPEVVTYREFLGDLFFTNLKELQTLGAVNDVRVIFWFDN